MNGGKGGVEKERSSKEIKFSKDKGKWKKDGKDDSSRLKIYCFLCNSLHRAFECPKRGMLTALVSFKKEKQDEEKRITFMHLLNTIQAKVEEHPEEGCI